MTTKIVGDIAIINNETVLIKDGASALDFIASIGYEYNVTKIAIDKTVLTEDFFRLSTGLAGEIVQKFVNYGYRVAIIGDFSAYTSKPLHDYIYECNNSKHLNFVADENEAVRRLSGKRDECARFYHGTKAELQVGDLLTAGRNSNFGKGVQANFVYFTGTMDAAVWGAELAQGTTSGKIYVVEPTGDFEDDPNLTDKLYPGNPTLSFRTKEPLRVIGEVEDWKGHPPEVLQAMLDRVNAAKEDGNDRIIEGAINFSQYQGALFCPGCGQQIATRYMTKMDKKEAYRFVPSAFHKKKV